MTILLLGEYSNFHNTLKNGLERLGHNVVLAGRKDGFKSFPVDISFDPILTVKPPVKYIRGLIYRVLNLDVSIFETIFYFLKNKKKFESYDIVQLINEYPIKTSPFFDKLLLKHIFKHNKRVFLSACGTDVIYLNYILNESLPYHILNPYQKDSRLKKHFKHSLNYLNNSHKKLNEFVFKNIKHVIPADIDYYMAYKNHPKAISLIPFPINIDKLKFTPLKISGKIKIFHGINRINYFKKGNDYFCKALKRVKLKYGDKIDVIEVEDIPYNEYINLYNESHILLDQVYSYDQGYNALEAMAKGKVVFTGVSEEFINYYKIDKTIAINAIPNVSDIEKNLSYLIENPFEIETIGQNARNFIHKYHNYIEVAKKYVNSWNV